MRYYADLHIHSSYSRATSKQLTLEHLSTWGLRKGIALIGTGDCLHPAWLSECKEKLIPEDDGFLSLRPEFARTTQHSVPASCAGAVRFLPTVEISNIYKKSGRVRKVHNLVCMPSLASVEKLITRLERIGNLKSDGRPILGLDSRDLLEIVLEADPHAILIPAHIWTPWFSALGSKSGFDSIQECYGDLTRFIYAVETGLSSDPPMNWQLTSLDPFALVSFSDAHSPSKLGRECTAFATDLSYDALFRALAEPENEGLAGTVEFFPEEGKYHVDGHRNCEVRFSPQETLDHKGICPVCAKPLTVGVLSRVQELADRKAGIMAPRARPFRSLVPLAELIGEALDTGAASKTAAQRYESLLTKVGSELFILLDAPIPVIAAAAGDLVTEGIRRMRKGEITIAPGYDGEFGTVKLFSEAERKRITGQTSLFGAPAPKTNPRAQKKTPPIAEAHRVLSLAAEAAPEYPAPDRATPPGSSAIFSNINEAQKAAILHASPHLLIVAGPGTGKTHTLTRRIARCAENLTAPQQCLALTFTNKAADEMRTRLARFGAEIASRVAAATIHAFCLTILREHAEKAGLTPSFAIAGPEDLEFVAHHAWPDASAAKRRELLEEMARRKARVPRAEDGDPEFVQSYNAALLSRNSIDFDTILQKCYELLQGHEEILDSLHNAFPCVFVDEYQDINEIQHALIVMLVGKSGTITAIGDPNQAIYGFRGAEVGFFGSFANDFPGAHVLSLVENYRTAPTILRAFGQVIAPSCGRGILPLVSAVRAQGRLTVHTAPTDKAEVEFVVHEIEKLVGGTSMFSRDSGRVGDDHAAAPQFGFADIAVLYRVNSLRRELEVAVGRSGIPFSVAGEKPFFARAAMSLLLRFLRFCSGERLSLESLCGLFEQAVPEFTRNSSSLLCACPPAKTRDFNVSELPNFLSSAASLPPAARRSTGAFLDTAQNVGAMLAAGNIQDALSCCTSLSPWKEDCAGSTVAQDALERLSRIARASASFRQFMDTVLLQREEDGVWSRSEAVSLMTLHAAKGLEWPVVFIIGCEEGIIPFAGKHFEVDRGEERRLLYVGMSRAKGLLYLTHAGERFSQGEKRPCLPSPFLADIEESLKCHSRPASFGQRPEKPESEQLSLPL